MFDEFLSADVFNLRNEIAEWPVVLRIAAIVAQQFETARQILGHGLMPIIEPEVLCVLI